MQQTLTLLTQPSGFPAGTTFKQPFGVNIYGEELWLAGVDLGSGVGYDLRMFRYDRTNNALTQIAALPGRNSLLNFDTREDHPVTFGEAVTTNRSPPTGTLVGFSISNNKRALRWTLIDGVVPIFDDIVGSDRLYAVSMNGNFALVGRDAGAGTVDVYVVPALGDPVLVIEAISDSAYFYWVSNDGQIIGGVDDSGDVDPFISLPAIWRNGVKEIIAHPIDNTYAEVTAASEDASVAACYIDHALDAGGFVTTNGDVVEFDPELTASYPLCMAVRPDGAASVWLLFGTDPGSFVGARALVRRRDGSYEPLAPSIDIVSMMQMNADFSRFYVSYTVGLDRHMALITIPGGFPSPFWTDFINSEVT